MSHFSVSDMNLLNPCTHNPFHGLVTKIFNGYQREAFFPLATIYFGLRRELLPTGLNWKTYLKSGLIWMITIIVYLIYNQSCIKHFKNWNIYWIRFKQLWTIMSKVKNATRILNHHPWSEISVKSFSSDLNLLPFFLQQASQTTSSSNHQL